MNARQQLTAATYGSNLGATYGFDAYGYPSSATTGAVQDYRYVFDPATGNLTSRENHLRTKLESFAYDNLDRLLTATGPQNLTMTYTNNGNLDTKSDIGTTAFGYGTGAGPYALTGVTSSTNVIPAFPQTITYNSFGKVSYINEANASQTINAFFTYNSDNQRAKMFVGVYYGAEILSRYYVGGSYMLEVQPGTTNEYTYLGGDAYTAPVVVHNNRGVVSYYYLLRDHLGNITHQVNTSNTVVAEYSFDAWGRRRNATDWSYNLTGQPALFADRGFTGHEYLSWFNLYNMNGRLYDPLVGRFLNADPVIQDPTYTQNYNRYSYCLNNPLKYVDLNGENQDDFWLEDGPGGGGGGGAVGGTLPGREPTRSEVRQREVSNNHGGSPSSGGGNNGGRGGGTSGGSGADSSGQGESGTSLPTNTVLSSIYFGLRNGVDGIWYQTTNFTGNSNDWRDGINTPDAQMDVINTFTGFKDVMSDVGFFSTIGDPIGRGAKNILDNRGAYMPNGRIYNMNSEITIRLPIGGINTTSKVLNYARIGGKVLFIAGIVATGVQVGIDVNNGNFACAGARATVFGIAAGAAFIPVVGWGIAAGIGAADYFWGDQFYNYLSVNRNQ